MGQEWIIGVCLNLAGSLLINGGTNVMKLAHVRNAKGVHDESTSVIPQEFGHTEIELQSVDIESDGKEAVNEEQQASVEKPRSPRPIWKSKVWLLGISLFAVGNGLNFASFGFAPQSLLAALGAIQFVSNVFFARFLLKEPITWRIVAATVIIVAGCILLVIFGPRSDAQVTAEVAMSLYSELPYIIYMVCVAVIAPLSWTLFHFAENLDKMIAWRAEKPVRVFHTLRPFTYTLYAAMIGTNSVLYAKVMSSLIQATIQGNNQFTSWYTYVAMLMLAITAVFWIVHLNKGLRLFPASIIVPTLQIGWTLFSVIGGGIFFQEFNTFTALQSAMFALGIAIIFTGVVLLTTSSFESAKVKPVSEEGELGSTGVEEQDVEEAHPTDLAKAASTPTPGLVARKVRGRGAGTNAELEAQRRVHSMQSLASLFSVKSLTDSINAAWRSLYFEDTYPIGFFSIPVNAMNGSADVVIRNAQSQTGMADPPSLPVHIRKYKSKSTAEALSRSPLGRPVEHDPDHVSKRRHSQSLFTNTSLTVPDTEEQEQSSCNATNNEETPDSDHSSQDISEALHPSS